MQEESRSAVSGGINALEGKKQDHGPMVYESKEVEQISFFMCYRVDNEKNIEKVSSLLIY